MANVIKCDSCGGVCVPGKDESYSATVCKNSGPNSINIKTKKHYDLCEKCYRDLPKGVVIKEVQNG